MKKLLFTLFAALMLTACGTAYNNQLKQVELGMSEYELVSLMGDKYNVVQEKDTYNKTLEYVDKYKFHWYFVFVDGSLNKWYKETEN